jgi:hypothetical protein
VTSPVRRNRQEVAVPRVHRAASYERYALGPVIAERLFTFHRRGKRPRPVRVRLGRPRPLPRSPTSDWMCTYQVLGLGREDVKRTTGVDALQALLLAAHVLPGEVAALAKQEEGVCRWLDGPDLWSDDGVRLAARYALPLSKRLPTRLLRRPRSSSGATRPRDSQLKRTRSAKVEPRGPRRSCRRWPDP